MVITETEINRIKRAAIKEAARAISEMCGKRVIQGVLSGLVGIDGDGDLDDDTVECGEMLFDALSSFRPECAHSAASE